MKTKNLVLILIGFCSAAFADTFSARPNIVLFLADDMGYGDIQAYQEQSFIETPNMNKLAEEGMMFTDGHSNDAICTPSRYGTLTGRYCWRTRLKTGIVWGNAEPLIESGRMTLASLLKENGYRTAGIGKWHLGMKHEGSGSKEAIYASRVVRGPLQLGFDYYFGVEINADTEPYCYLDNDMPVVAPTVTLEGSSDPYWREGIAAPDWDMSALMPDFTDKSIEFIDNHIQAAPDDPFFIYFAFTAPHKPHIPADFINTGQGSYADMIALCDWSVGQVMQALKDHGVYDNTLVIFTSDNGARSSWNIKHTPGHDCNYPLRGEKGKIWEGGHRVPFIVSWPGYVEAGSVNHDIVNTTDYLATLAAVVGAQLPDSAGEDSRSFLPALLNLENSPPGRQDMVNHTNEGSGMYAMRLGEWKYIPETGELFNLNDDLEEENNLITQNPDKVGELEALLQKYQEGTRSAPQDRNDLITAGCKDPNDPLFDPLAMYHDSTACTVTGISHVSAAASYGSPRGLELRVAVPEKHTVTVYSPAGKTICVRNGRDETTYRFSEIEEPGLYIIHIAAGQGSQWRKVLMKR